MKKELIRIETEEKKSYYSLLDTKFKNAHEALEESKHYLIIEELRRINLLLSQNNKSIIASAILELERNSVLEIPWDNLLKEL